MGELEALLVVTLLAFIKLALEQMQPLPHWFELFESSDNDMRVKEI